MEELGHRQEGSKIFSPEVSLRLQKGTEPFLDSEEFRVSLKELDLGEPWTHARTHARMCGDAHAPKGALSPFIFFRRKTFVLARGPS